MKEIIILIIILLSFTSCKAQNVEPLKRGYAIAIVVGSNENGSVMNAGGKSLIVNGGELESGVEYDIVYDIQESRSGSILVVNFVAAERSARQGAKDRSKLMLLLR